MDDEGNCERCGQYRELFTVITSEGKNKFLCDDCVDRYAWIIECEE